MVIKSSRATSVGNLVPPLIPKEDKLYRLSSPEEHITID